MDDNIKFVLAIVTLLGVPGPTNTLLATSGALMGTRRALPLVLVEACGYITSILLISVLLRPIFIGWPGLAVAFRAAVIVYLLFVAVKLFVRDETIQPTGVSAQQLFLATLLNPKGLILGLVVIPFDAPHVWLYLLAFLMMLLPIGALWVALGASLGRLRCATQQRRLITRTSASVLFVFAALLFVSTLQTMALSNCEPNGIPCSAVPR